MGVRVRRDVASIWRGGDVLARCARVVSEVGLVGSLAVGGAASVSAASGPRPGQLPALLVRAARVARDGRSVQVVYRDGTAAVIRVHEAD